MKTNILAATILSSLILLSCSSHTLQEEETRLQGDTTNVVEQDIAVEPFSSMASKYQRTIKLDNGFEIQVGDEEDYERFKTYTLFKLNLNWSVIYMDSSLT